MNKGTNKNTEATTFEAVPITLPQGLIGFSDFKKFGLLSLPDERLSQFKLLQALDDPDLSFLVIPINLDDGPIDSEDIDAVLKELNIRRENAAVLSIITVRKENGGFSATTNLRAPIFIDTSNSTARQHIIPSDKYDIRHALV